MDMRNVMSVSTDTEAEELLLWIQEQKSIRDRLIETDKAMIEKYQEKLAQHDEGYQQATAQAMQVLGQYCREHAMRNTKTTVKTFLPSGTLQWRKQNPEIKHDDNKLLDWVKSSLLNPDVWIKTEEKVDWKEFKEIMLKGAIVVGNHYEIPDDNGALQAVDGIEVIEREEKFEIG